MTRDGRDQATLTSFVSAARSDLVKLTYMITGSEEDAQDVVHDVLTRLVTTRLADVDDLWSYARRDVVNECATWGRRWSRHLRGRNVLSAEWRRVLADQPDPYGRVELMSTLQALSPRERTAVVLRYHLDWADADIAAALDCRPATARSLLSRALRKLRTELQGEWRSP